jgi:hypothetical protein
MALLKKTLFDEKLETYNVLVEDNAPLSTYFKITELPDTFTGGKNGFLIQGSPELVADSIIKIQIKDSQGNTIYNEPGEGIPEYYEGTSKVVAVYIYPDTSFGPCTITILGELKEYYSNGVLNPVPLNWEGTYNVRWQRQVNVNPLLQNTTKIRFYRRPKVDIQETILPIYNRTVNRVTISGSVDGVAVNPITETNFRTFKGDTLYELQISGSNFSSSMEGEVITITDLNQAYSTTIKDVVTSNRAYATIPYYETSSATSPQLIKEFSSASFELTYNESVTLTNSSVSSSFAKIKLTDLEAFSGDVNRLKIFASRKADIGNYTLLEDIQLESTELLQTDEYSGSVAVRTGQFTSDKLLNDFWVYRNYNTVISLPISIDNTTLASSVKLEDSGILNTTRHNERYFSYKIPLEFTKDSEYQLDFTPLLSSSFFGNAELEVYVVGTAFVNTDSDNDGDLELGKMIGKIQTTKSFQKFDKQQINFKADNTGTGTIFFENYQGNWHLSNISLRAAAESSFSPNEITLNVAVPTKVKNDTFDFKFEFYDVNNNYVPVSLNQEFTFTGGNDLVVRKSITVTPDGNLFSFSGSGDSIGVSSINFDIAKVGLTGSTIFYSSAFDENGDYIQPSVYGSEPFYPGLLTNITETSATLLVSNFTGSLSSPKVTRVLYTASCEDVQDLVNIYRVDQGANGANGSDGATFITVANKSQFVYDPDNKNVPAQLNDFIDIKLSSNIIEGSLSILSGSFLPKLTKLTTTQVGYYTESVYRIFSGNDEEDVAMLGTNAASWSYNTPNNDIHKGTYIFTQNGFSASIQLEGVLKGDKSKNLNSVSNANQFFYKMTDLSLSPSGQTITIDVKRNNLGSTSNAITVTSGSGKPALTIGSNNAITGVQSYSIGGANYPYSAGATTYTFFAEDLNFDDYTDTITITPVIAESQIAVNASNENTTFPAYSGGTVFGGFLASSGSLFVKVGSEDIAYASTIGNNKFSASIASSTNVTGVITNNNYSITALSADSGSLNLKVTYRDGRGTDSIFTKLVTYSKAKSGNPNVLVAVSPQSQTLAANSLGVISTTPTSLTVTALEGGTNRLTSVNAQSSNVTIGTISGGTIPISAVSADNASVAITASFTDSEGTSGTKFISATLSKAKAAPPTVVVSLDKDGQTITKTQGGSYGVPSPFRVTVAEGASAYTYDGSTPYGSSTFVITSVTNATRSGVDGQGFATIQPSTPSSTSTLLVSITGSYVNSEGSTTTFFKTHNVNVASDGTNGAQGATGPGIVLRGEWTNNTLYYYTTVAGSSRRDAVYKRVSGTTHYWATLEQHTSETGVKELPAVNNDNTYWQYLGSQDFFVAAKIGLFDDSFVKSTLNVGTNSQGSAANITLAGGNTSPYVSIGQGTQGYENNGIWLGIVNGTTPKVSFVSGSNYFKYDANATNIVDIGGRISATSLTAQTGSIGGFEIQSNILQAGTPSNGIRLDGGSSVITAGNSSGNASARMSTLGFYAGNATFGNAPFRVNTDGFLVATNADIQGKVTATLGTIGGWSINETSIFKNRITLYAGADTNYIQITGDAGGSFAGNRVYIHPGALSSLGGGGASINATVASNYVDITSPTIMYAGNSSSTQATIGTSAQSVSSLSGTSTYNVVSRIKFKVDVVYPTVNTNSTYNATNTYFAISQAAESIAYYTKYAAGLGSPQLGLPLINLGWIGNGGSQQQFDFVSAYNAANGTSYGSLSSMAAGRAAPWTVTTQFYGVNGSVGISAVMNYNGVTQQNGYAFAPISQITSAESNDLTYNINSFGNGTTGVRFDVNKTNTISSLYKRVTWNINYYSITFEGQTYSGIAVWASSAGYESVAPSSVTISAKAVSLSATELTKQVELSEAGMQAVFNLQNDSAGNYFRVSDVGVPSITNFNIKSAGFFAHYGELHVKGDIAAFSTALSSDRRLKKNIVDIEDTEIEDMDKLHPVTYSWKDDTNNKKHYGFIAQDVQKIYPHLTETKIVGEYLTINYNELIPVMVKQIQNLKKELEDVKKVLSNGK